MSDERSPVGEADAATLRRELWRVAKAVETQQLSLTSTCLVTAGLVAGFVGFGLMLEDEAFKHAPLGTTVPLAIYVVVLTPLAGMALATRTERVVTTALGVWGLAGLAAVFGGLHAIMAGGDGMLGLGALHLLGAAMLGFLGLWLLPGQPDEE